MTRRSRPAKDSMGQLSLFDPPPAAAFQDRDGLQKLLSAWVERGWLRPLDQAVSNLLVDLFPDCPPLALLAAALASHQLGRGHVCLDLEATLAAPDLALSLPPDDDAADGERPVLPSEALAGVSLAYWREQLLAASGAVCHKPACLAQSDDEEHPGHPLVLVDHPVRPRVYLRRYWRYEQQVARTLHRRLAAVAAPPADLRRSLDALFAPAADGLPDWQKIACALAARGNLTLITGGPGTGKTTTVIRLLALLQGNALAQGRPLRIRLAAPTGKAAARLTASIAGQIAALPVDDAVRQAIPAEVSTLHRLLGSRPGSRHFVHDRDNPLPLDVLVVDEASMIDLEMMASLLEALPDRTRLVLLGDKDQLASVEAGAVLGDLCHEADFGHYTAATLDWIETHAGHRLADPALRPGDAERHALAQQTVMLRHSRRFGADSGIGRLARAINEGDAEACRLLFTGDASDLAVLLLDGESGPALERLALHGHRDGRRAGYGHYLGILRDSRPQAGPDASPADPAWNDWAVRVLEAFGSFQVLAALRSGPWGVEGLNTRIARALQGAGLVDGHEGWYEGRPVLVTRNDYGLGVMNGDIGIALRVPVLHGLGGAHTVRRELRVAFIHPDDSRRARFLHPSRLTAVETAFAMTVHKSQGSEFDHAALVLPDRLNPILTRELVYTAVTRARGAFTLVEHRPDVLDGAVRQKVVRESGLIDLMWPAAPGGQ
ncbi:MAG TPA: exodeoxyribonuclease V subunit alpha [Rhodocyclaceae bacterium]|nr:exodeoxyribonuclease V subunit alpha [Rhodocyclaceae bacterium]